MNILPRRAIRRVRPRFFALFAAVIAVVAVPLATAGRSSAASYGSPIRLPFTALNGPNGLAVNSSGDVFLASANNSRIFEINPGGVQSTVAGLSGLNYPEGLTMDAAGDIYLADTLNDRVVELPKNGTQVTLPFTGLGPDFGVALDSSGDVYVANTGDSRVSELKKGGSQVNLAFSGLDEPFGIALDSAGDVFVANTDGGQVLEMSPTGVQTTVGFTGLVTPYGVAVDHSGDVFVTDVGANKVVELTKAGVQVTLGFSGLVSPTGIAVDGSGDVFVSNTGGPNANEVFELPVASNSASTSTTVPATTTTSTTTTSTTVPPTTTTTVGSPATTVPSSTGSGSGVAGCGLAQVAFCDTFAEGPEATGNRSGQLNGSVWGVSRESGAFNNLGQGEYDAVVNQLQIGGTCPARAVGVDTNILICNGEMNEVVNDNPDVNASNLAQLNDNGTVTSMAMYPKQPFNFAGRTGKIVFDVSDDSGGSHAAWPEIWVTSTPDPDPYTHLSSWLSLPQYGFGIRLDAVCGAGDGASCGPECPSNNTTPVVSVNDAIVVNNYVENDPDNGGGLQTVHDGCVTEPTAAGQLNHFEIDVSQNQIDVYGTNAGTTSPLIHLAEIPDADLGFTQGLLWLEDVHYNANKGVNTAMQAMHTFTWSDVGFDGPVLPRDLAFDAADADTPVAGFPTLTNLGWESCQSTPATIDVPGVTGINQAAGGLLTFNFLAPDVAPVNLDYTINGNPTQTYNWPFADDTAASPRTVAIPIPLTQVQTGTNTIQIWSPQDCLILSNLDLVMRGAGGTVQP